MGFIKRVHAPPAGGEKEAIMILILNVMKDENLAVSFDRALDRALESSGKQVDYIRVSEHTAPPDISGYSHVILSGSEASVNESNPWDAVLAETVRETVQQGKPLLGICYGHQFLVGVLAGKQYVRRSATPEFGWAAVRLEDNPLFNGLSEPVFMVSHYDEVFDLPHDFRVIASSPYCRVHGFRYRDLPVWGVQFHPEYNIEEAEEIFQWIAKHDPTYIEHRSDEAYRGEAHLEQNQLIFKNFLKT